MVLFPCRELYPGVLFKTYKTLVFALDMHEDKHHVGKQLSELIIKYPLRNANEK